VEASLGRAHVLCQLHLPGIAGLIAPGIFQSPSSLQRVVAYPAFRRSATGWCKARSSSYWNRSSRWTSNRGRLDTGYFSAANVAACDKAGIEPLIAMGRQPHHPPLAELFQTAPEAPQDPTPVEAMAHRLKTPAGRALYALRKQMPEPVFGIIKSALGFRQFSLRGLNGARGEWSLVTMAWNIKRLFALVPA